MRPENLPKMIEQGELPEIAIVQRPGEPKGANTYLLTCQGNRFDVPVSIKDLENHFGFEDRETFELHEEIKEIVCRILRPLAAILKNQPHDPLSPTNEQLESVLVLYALLKDALNRIATIKRDTARHIADKLAATAAEKILDRHTYELYVKCRALRGSSSPPHRKD